MITQDSKGVTSSLHFMGRKYGEVRVLPQTGPCATSKSKTSIDVSELFGRLTLGLTATAMPIFGQQSRDSIAVNIITRPAFLESLMLCIM